MTAGERIEPTPGVTPRAELRQIVPSESSVLGRARTLWNVPGATTSSTCAATNVGRHRLQGYVAWKCDTENTPLRTYVANRRDPYYRWLYDKNAFEGEEIQFFTVRPVPFDSDNGMELDGKVRKLGVGYTLDGGKLLLN